VVIVKIRPLAEVFRFPLGTGTLCDDALDDFVGLVFFFQALFVQEKRFVIFWGEIGCVEKSLIGFIGFDVVVNAFEPFEAF
jgi:hypothetical protein